MATPTIAPSSISSTTSAENFEVRFKPKFLEQLPQSAKKVALLATTEYEGIFKNGGIGTYYATLSRKLAGEGWYIILLLFQTKIEFKGESEIPALAHIFSAYEAQTVLDLKPIHLAQLSGLQEWDWLEYENYSALFFTQAITNHFQNSTVYVEFAEMCGLGHYTIQAKKAGVIGENCITAVTMHSGQEWIYQANGKYIIDAPDWYRQACLFEQLSFENADLAFFLSHFLKAKVESFGWKTDRALYLPYCFPIMEELLENSRDLEYPKPEIEAGKIPIAFFGRLEERKGLQTFIQAIQSLDAELAQKIHIVFCGKIVNLYTEALRHLNSQEYIDRELGEWCNYSIMNGLFSQQAVKLVSELPNAIVCLTSPEENFPNSSLEMGQLPISLIASATGGFQETLGLIERTDCVRWFQPKNSHSLAKAIAQAITAYPEKTMIPDREFLQNVNQRLLEKRIEYMESASH